VDKFRTFIGHGNNLPIRKMHELSQLKNGISNFVRIIAKRSIPVEFQADNDGSYTDFNKVVISAAISENNFDIICGLAMHEGSHIRYTDRDYLTNILGIDADGKFETSVELYSSIRDVYENMMDREIEALAIKKKFMPDIPQSAIGESDKNFYAGVMKFFINWVKQTANWVEDRRIDKLVYTDAPGYKGYYDALYNYYFLNEDISTGLKSDEYTKEDFGSYGFRLVNCMNDDHREDVLNGLPEIMEILDLDNIEKVDGIRGSYDKARDILKVVLANVDELDKEDIEKQMKEKGNGEGDDSEIDYDKLDLSDMQLGNGTGTGKQLDLGKLNEKQLIDLEKAIKEQKELIDGSTFKEGISEGDKQNIDAISNKSLNIVPVRGTPESTDMGGNTTPTDDMYNGEVYDVIVLKNVNKETFFNSNIFPFNASYGRYEDEVRAGIHAGKKLGNKLLIRNDERTTDYSRKTSGKIDKRLLSDLGFGGESIFTQMVMETYTNSILHISIDGSGSMSGQKLGQCVQLATTVCMAADMIDNLEVVVSIRGTRDSDPFIAVVYDSRVDTIKKVKELFPNLDTSGTTPEGLCFAAIQDQIEKTSGTLKSYFINLSDGEPYFSGYSGHSALLHTQQEVHKMALKKIKILSYYIGGGGWYGGDEGNFNIMYGKYAATIDVNSIGQISKTLNKLFLER